MSTPLQLRPHQIVLRPLISEKGTHQIERYNAFPFEVHVNATKDQIKAAIEELFDVRVLGVRTATYKGKATRRRFTPGRRPMWKKAIVTLHEDDRIEFF
jgi:large subunit ribosomal protein L23